MKSMKISNRQILTAIVVITLFMIPALAFSIGALRIIVGFPLFLFFPGYTLLSSIYPGKGKLSDFERIAISIGLSIATVTLIGLVMNFSPWGLNLWPVLIATTIFIIITASIGFYLEGRLPVAEQRQYKLSFKLIQWQNTGTLDKALLIILMATVVSALGYIVYFAVTPNQGERYTEFYILDTEGKAENYPKEAALGEPVEFMVNVVNHEDADTRYNIMIKVNSNEVMELDTGSLNSEERWQKTVSIVPESTGEGQKIELWLYMNNDTQPYNRNSLHFYINVFEPSSRPS